MYRRSILSSTCVQGAVCLIYPFIYYF
jgi:hypothetical protein